MASNKEATWLRDGGERKWLTERTSGRRMSIMERMLTRPERHALGRWGAAHLREARDKTGLTQADVARKTGASLSGVARWDRGDDFPRRAELVLNLLRVIKEACGLAPGDCERSPEECPICSGSPPE